MPRADQGVGRFPPFFGRLSPGQDKSTGTRARKLHEASYLSAAAPWIEQGAHQHHISGGAYQCAMVRWHPRANSSNDGTFGGISGFHISLRACIIYAIYGKVADPAPAPGTGPTETPHQPALGCWPVFHHQATVLVKNDHTMKPPRVRPKSSPNFVIEPQYPPPQARTSMIAASESR
jgi:hypothetical protein